MRTARAELLRSEGARAMRCAISLPRWLDFFLNSGFFILLSGKGKNDRHYPLRYAETLCWILHNMLHTLLFSGLETGNRRLFDDGGSISCLPADPR